MKRFLSWLFSPAVLVALALLMLALLVWFEGPEVALSGAVPLATPTARLATIGALLLAWCGYWAWRWLKEKIAATRLAKLAAASGGKEAEVAPGDAEVKAEMAQLSARMREAIDTLRKMRGKDAGRQSVYELPWYMFVGAPGSGKTTALLNSGLRFPLAGKFGNAPIAGVGGTRHCEWWFTDEAVLLDTAGRYTTQDSYAEVDNAAWHGFLELLKKHRSRRPINGVIVVLSLADLLQKDEAARRQLALTLRERIKELHAHLGIRFPIYVMVTKCDLLAGFAEFFEALGPEEQKQVWGVTFMLEGAERIDEVLDTFPAEFQSLEAQLQAHALHRLQQERDLQRRALVYGFPQQFAGIGEPLTQMLNQIFVSTRFDERAMLRGVYFTSGTQEGNPIDRVVGSLASAFGIERQALRPNVASGRSYFVTQLMRSVIFREAGLAGGNLRLERNRRLLQWGALVAMAVVLVSITIIRVTSYRNNLDYVNLLARRTATADKLARTTLADDALPATLPLLEAVRLLPTGYAERDAGVPLLMRFGLYQGATLGPAAIDAYERLLRQSLLPRLVARLEEQLRRGAANNADYLYEGLRMYLMLGQPAHFDADALQAWFDLDWQLNAAELGDEQRRQLGAHVAALLGFAEAADKPLAKLDPALVEETRLVLARLPLPQRLYARLKQDVATLALPEFSASAVSGQGASLVLARRSGAPLSRGVPGMYTIAGYKRFAELADQAVTDMARDGWVLGQQDAISNPDAIVETRAALRELYYTDYIAQWDAYLADVGIVPFASLEEGARLASVLAGPESPLRKFLQAAARETTLERAGTGVALADAVVNGVKGKIDAYKNRLAQALGSEAVPAAPVRLANPVDAHFRALHELVGPPPVPGAAPAAPAPIDKMLATIKDVAVYFDDAARARRSGAPMPPADALDKARREAQDQPQPLAAMLQNFDGIGASIAQDSDRARISAAWSLNAGPFCRQAIAGRYPLVRTATGEVTADDFGRFFAPGGLIDDFFQKNLLPFVDMGGARWRWRPNAAQSLGFGPEVLAEFERAARIRDMFFSAGGKLAAMRFELKPLAGDTSLGNVLLEIEGQALNYVPNGAVNPVLFQIPSGKRSGVVRFETTPSGKLPDPRTEGSWAWLRMLDHAVLETTAQPERYRLGFDLEGRKVQYEMTASSVINPFRREALEQFRCPELP